MGWNERVVEALEMLASVLAISESGAAGDGAYAEVGTTVLEGKYDWITVEVACAGADMTGAGFKIEKLTASGGIALPWLAGTDFANAAYFKEGEESGVDDQGSGHHAHLLDDGESVFLTLRVTGVYSVKFSAIGVGATITITGSATKGG